MRKRGYIGRKGQNGRNRRLKEMTLDKYLFQELLNEVAREEEKMENKCSQKKKDTL
jgi:hypothetical protein